MQADNDPHGALYIYNGPANLQDLERVNLTGARIFFNGSYSLRDLCNVNFTGATVFVNGHQTVSYPLYHLDCELLTNQYSPFRLPYNPDPVPQLDRAYPNGAIVTTTAHMMTFTNLEETTIGLSHVSRKVDVSSNVVELRMHPTKPTTTTFASPVRLLVRFGAQTSNIY